MRGVRVRSVLAILGLALAAMSTRAEAQLNTQHVKGVTGLKAGTQPPPHLYVIAPLLYFYSTDEIKNRDGTTLPTGGASLTASAYAGGINVVTSKKLFGGMYGYQILFPVLADNALQGAAIDESTGTALSDSAVTPISLGWHAGRADAMVSYSLFVPTGRYTDGARTNTGFGMWAQEPAAGATVYFDKAHMYHVSTLASFDFQSKKEGSDTKVGNTMNLEGGAGADFLKGGLTAGLVYYTTLKLSADQIDGFPDILIRGKNKVFALGPEMSLALAKDGVLYGSIKINYEWETYARTTTMGGELTVVATFLVKPLKLPSTP